MNERLPVIEGDWTVFAFSDAHGVASGLLSALREAGVVDADGHWIAPPRTALVGCGDYIDRGGDVRGTVDLLQGLSAEAKAADGAVHLARGNHEAMPLMARDGSLEWLATWLEFGGRATLASYGCDDHPDRDPGRALESLRRCAPELFTWMAALHEAVRWRDVLFVHGGLVPGHGPEDLGVGTDEHIWIRGGFFASPWDPEAYGLYGDAGIERVVFGHTPHPYGPTPFHDGRSLNIDTNAVGDPRQSAGAPKRLTLLCLEGDTTFADARVISVDTSDAIDTFVPD